MLRKSFIISLLFVVVFSVNAYGETICASSHPEYGYAYYQCPTGEWLDYCVVFDSQGNALDGWYSVGNEEFHFDPYNTASIEAAAQAAAEACMGTSIDPNNPLGGVDAPSSAFDPSIKQTVQIFNGFAERSKVKPKAQASKSEEKEDEDGAESSESDEDEEEEEEETKSQMRATNFVNSDMEFGRFDIVLVSNNDSEDDSTITGDIFSILGSYSKFSDDETMEYGGKFIYQKLGMEDFDFESKSTTINLFVNKYELLKFLGPNGLVGISGTMVMPDYEDAENIMGFDIHAIGHTESNKFRYGLMYQRTTQDKLASNYYSFLLGYGLPIQQSVALNFDSVIIFYNQTYDGEEVELEGAYVMSSRGMLDYYASENFGLNLGLKISFSENYGTASFILGGKYSF
jgi:hypothetical protein